MQSLSQRYRERILGGHLRCEDTGMEATGVPEHLQTMESVNDLKTKIHELEEKNASALAAVERELKTRMEAISGDVVEELRR